MFTKGLLKGKTIIVTGGGTGLGRSMATRFSELGASVVIASRKIDILERTAAEITRLTGGDVVPVRADVRQFKEVEAVIDTAEAKFGSVEGLVNNAAGNFISPTEALSHKAFDVIVDIVLRGTYNFSLALGKRWIEKNSSGTMLNIVTTYASTGSGYVVPSSVSKAGVLNLTRSLAAEWGGRGIRVNAIAPGAFPTEGAWEKLVPDRSFEEKMIERIPLGRVGKHSELANLAAYLMADGSGYITGEVITIDGGEWLAGAGQFNLLKNLSSDDWVKIRRKTKR